VAGNASASPFGNLPGPVPDLVCYSHLRWNFVFQRPQHLMTRFTKHLRVFFVEEPHWDAAPDGAWLEVQTPRPNLWVVVPHLPDNLSATNRNAPSAGCSPRSSPKTASGSSSAGTTRPWPSVSAATWSRW
jgi:hypothetical protein